MTRFPTASKKKKYIKKKSNGNLSSKRQNILKSASMHLTLIFMCYLQEYFLPISGAYRVIYDIKRNQSK